MIIQPVAAIPSQLALKQHLNNSNTLFIDLFYVYNNNIQQSLKTLWHNMKTSSTGKYYGRVSEILAEVKYLMMWMLPFAPISNGTINLCLYPS